MKYLAPIPKQFVDQNGLPLSNGAVHVYISGDTQYANVYQDADGNELMPNPARLDSNGAWVGFVTAGIPLDYVVEDKDGNVQFEYEKVVAGGGDGGGESTETIDGDEYKVITAAGYLWMAQNYRKPEGAYKGQEYTTAAYMYPNDDIDNVEKFGLLYNYHAAKNIIDSHNGGDYEWHVISRTEMSILLNYVTGNVGEARSGYYLKSIDGWEAGNSSIDIIGFGAVGAGQMNESWHWPPEPEWFKKNGTLWTSTPYNASTLYFRVFEYNSNNSSEGYNGQSIGYSIRLCKKL